jgi:outer membrane receptor protein involved in Fe transport
VDKSKCWWWCSLTTYTLESFQASNGGANPALLKAGSFPEFKPESVKTYEIGYKGLLANKKLLADVYTYFGTYTNFIARALYAQVVGGVPNYVSIPQNVVGNVKTNGFGISLDYSLPRNFMVGFNLSSDKLGTVPAGFQAGFNAPQYRTNLTVGNTGFGAKKRMSFNAVWRWQDAYTYEGDFANGSLPEVHTVDAQFSYKIPEKKSTIKIGAANLLNQYYRNGFGNANVGGLYYVSYGYNL